MNTFPSLLGRLRLAVMFDTNSGDFLLIKGVDKSVTFLVRCSVYLLIIFQWEIASKQKLTSTQLKVKINSMETKAKSLRLTKEGDLPEKHEANQVKRWRFVSSLFFVTLGSIGIISISTGLFSFQWWALLLYLPAFFLGERVIRAYAQTRTLSADSVQDALGWSGISFALATTLLFNLNWLFALLILGLVWGSTHILVRNIE